MKRIESFCINHNKLQKGLYLSRIDGDAVTYDLRMAIPNSGTYLENDGIHTFEHLAATYLRNSSIAEEVIYVGPMGCRTGFYLIFRDTVGKDQAIAQIRQTLAFIAGFEGEIPGATAIECGNCREHNLQKARVYALNMLQVLRDWTPEQMRYEE